MSYWPAPQPASTPDTQNADQDAPTDAGRRAPAGDFAAQTAALRPANDPRQMCLTPAAQFEVDLSQALRAHDISWVERLPAEVRDDIDREYSIEKAAEPSRKEKKLLKQEVTKSLKATPEYGKMTRREQRQAVNNAYSAALRARRDLNAQKAALEVVTPKSQKGGETLVTIPAAGVTRLEGRKVARINFVSMMTGVFGTPEAACAHFMGMGPANVPGKPWVSKETRVDLERASQMFEARYPGHRFASTTVAFALRNRHHAAHSAGMLGHVLGLSLDYQAYDNPHLKDPEERAMIELMGGGGPSHLVFEKANGDELNYTARRQLIAKMRDETVAAGSNLTLEQRDPATRALMQQLDGAYDRMVQTSQGLRTSLVEGAPEGADPIAELQEAGELYWGRRKTIKSLERKIKGVDKKVVRARKQAKRRLERDRKRAIRKGIEAPEVTDAAVDADAAVVKLLQQREALETQLQGLTADLTATTQRVLAPWQAKLTETMAQLGTQAGVSPTATVDLKLVKAAYKKVRYARKSDKRLTRVMNTEAYAELFAGLARPGDGVTSQQAADAALDRLNALARIAMYQNISSKLGSNLDYVLGAKSKTVSNPAVLQLVTRGIIRDDAMALPEATEDGAAEGDAPNKSGDRQPVFNREFIGVMMENGFDTGAAWSTADSMHFDHVPSFSVFQRGKVYGPQGVRDKS